MVNEKTGEVSRLHGADSSKVNLVAAIDIYEDDEAELLLCYNSKYLNLIITLVNSIFL